MAKIILKCRYLKQGSREHSANLVQYIAKRDGVEMLDDSRKYLPVTGAQKRLIADILEDFPDAKDSFAYEDYMKAPGRGTASAFISSALDENIDLIGKRENYVGYIARRPGTEKSGSHGLFSDQNIPIVLSRVAEEVSSHPGNIWTNILSLKREDAARLGYDQGAAWRDLLRSQTETMARCMKIPLEDLRWYAAFHNEGHHPHVHIIAYSVGREAYLSNQGIQQMKSAFAREIFKEDLLPVYVKQTEYRDTLLAESKSLVEKLIEEIHMGNAENKETEVLLLQLSEKLQNVKGKKVYGYLPQNLRILVNQIVDYLEKEPAIVQLYDLWYQQKDEITGVYQDAACERVPLSKNKVFHSLRNVVVKEALQLAYGQEQETERESEIELETEKKTETAGTAESVKRVDFAESVPHHRPEAAAYIRLLHHTARIFQSQMNLNQKKLRTDRKLRRAEEEKKKAHGLKINSGQHL